MTVSGLPGGSSQDTCPHTLAARTTGAMSRWAAPMPDTPSPLGPRAGGRVLRPPPRSQGGLQGPCDTYFHVSSSSRCAGAAPGPSLCPRVIWGHEEAPEDDWELCPRWGVTVACPPARARVPGEVGQSVAGPGGQGWPAPTLLGYVSSPLGSSRGCREQAPFPGAIALWV